jgi:hypothetical protein
LLKISEQNEFNYIELDKARVAVITAKDSIIIHYRDLFTEADARYLATEQELETVKKRTKFKTFLGVIGGTVLTVCVFLLL